MRTIENEGKKMKIYLEHNDIFTAAFEFVKRKGFTLREDKSGARGYIGLKKVADKELYYMEILVEVPKDDDPYRDPRDPAMMRAWHFLEHPGFLSDGSRAASPGQVERVEGKVVLHKNGLHSSSNPLDALARSVNVIEPGRALFASCVEPLGEVVASHDEVASSERRRLWTLDSLTTAVCLLDFARRCALSVLDTWLPALEASFGPTTSSVVRRFLELGPDVVDGKLMLKHSDERYGIGTVCHEPDERYYVASRHMRGTIEFYVNAINGRRTHKKLPVAAAQETAVFGTLSPAARHAVESARSSATRLGSGGEALDARASALDAAFYARKAMTAGVKDPVERRSAVEAAKEKQGEELTALLEEAFVRRGTANADEARRGRENDDLEALETLRAALNAASGRRAYDAMELVQRRDVDWEDMVFSVTSSWAESNERCMLSDESMLKLIEALFDALAAVKKARPYWRSFFTPEAVRRFEKIFGNRLP